ncbi:hypothetical protein HY214_05285 [Candidatus Roizmanbacteria bacterium]|nr:hypothetical protein [Candidatus Roizmanbacteria bacterium]
MNTTPVPARIREILAKSQQGAIALPVNPSIDAVAAATALYLTLQKAGKSIVLVSENPVTLDLVGAEKIQSDLVASGDNLVISFPYSDGAIDKVDYNIVGDRFNLIITPRPGSARLNPKDVTFSYAGGLLDFMLTVDAPTLNSLGVVYTDNQPQFQGRDLINIDRHLTNGMYGTVNFVNKTSSSISELVFNLLTELEAEFDRDIATNLYAGIAAATNNFTSYSVNAATFETVAALLRKGAIRKTIKKPGAPGLPSPSFRQPLSNLPQSPSHEFQQSTKPIEEVEKQTNPEGPPAPQDWLKPKIFKGGGMI